MAPLAILLGTMGNKTKLLVHGDKKLQYQAHVFYALAYKIRGSGDKDKVGKNFYISKHLPHT